MRDLRTDRRALGWNIIVFIATIVIAGLMFLLLDPIQGDLAARTANQTSSNATQSGYDWLSQAWTVAPLATVLLGMVQLIAAAAVERGGL